jgi:hypothetical protein
LDWVFNTFDRFLAAVFVAVFGIAAAQIEPFATQYSARTLTQFVQAQAHLKDVQGGVRYQTMAPNVRAELEAQARSDLATRQKIHTSVANTLPQLKPFALWRSGDETILNTTWQSFVPGLPFTWAGAVNTLIGALVGFALYELLKFPVVTFVRAPPRRRFKKRG